MKNNIQGPSYYITIASITVLIINIMKEREDANCPAVQECIHSLEDFLWNFAGIATDNGDDTACDNFLETCGYNK